MPSTHTTPTTKAKARGSAPTAKQLRYLRFLADQLGQSFATPKTRHQATQEIDRLLDASQQRDRPRSRTEAHIDRRVVSRDLHEHAGGATAYREDEITGYGSSATWAHRS